MQQLLGLRFVLLLMKSRQFGRALRELLLQRGQ